MLLEDDQRSDLIGWSKLRNLNDTELILIFILMFI